MMKCTEYAKEYARFKKILSNQRGIKKDKKRILQVIGNEKAHSNPHVQWTAVFQTAVSTKLHHVAKK